MTRTTHAVLALALVSGCTANASFPGTGQAGTDGSITGGDDSGTDPGGPISPPVYPTTHPRIYLGPNAARLTSALAAHTPEATRFKTVTDQWVGGANQWGFQAWNAALMGQLTSGDTHYCAAAVAAIETQVTTAESAIAAGSAPVVADDSYLYIGDSIGDLALVYDWCNGAISGAQKTRWLAYADQAVANVWDHAHASWGGHAFSWSGWATDDPSDNYYYSFMRATMMLGLATQGEDSHADAWLTMFRTTKLGAELVPTFDSDLGGGASREGTGYGVSMRRLFELYDWWDATTGEAIARLTPHTRASILAFMHQTLPTLDRIAPTGDQARDSTASYFDYHRQYLAELVALFPGDPLSPRAEYLNSHSSIPAMSDSFMAAYDFLYAPPVVEKPLTGLGTAYFAKGIGELYARSGWDTHATWINLIAGAYTESHAHQDQGALMLYKDGWLAYDSVIDSHSGLRQETTAHSVVRIDRGGQAIPQRTGTVSQLVALQQGTGWVHAAADVTAAYGGNAAITQDQREIVYLQPDIVVVFDRVATAADTTQVWQLASPVKPVITGATATFTNAGHVLHVQRLVPASATATAFDYTQDASGDYSGGFRLDETVAGGPQQYLHVLSVDGAVTSTTAIGTTGVTITLADGRVAVVTFTAGSVGASLTLAGVTTVLPTGLTPLAE